MDDAKLRALLRSVLVMAAAAPAVVVFACGDTVSADTSSDAGPSDAASSDDAAMMSAVVDAKAIPIADASMPDVLRLPPNDTCMTYGFLPADGGYGTQTPYEAGVCASACEPPADLDAATPPTECWALRDPRFGDFLGCAYPNGDASVCGCASVTRKSVGPYEYVYEPLPCQGVPTPLMGGFNDPVCTHVCPPTESASGGCGLTSCTIADPSDPPGSLRCVYCFATIGRRAAGAVEPPAARGTQVGRFLADARYREAASVVAFSRMREELLAHGAPRELVERTERAREDEVRHAVIMAHLARRFGAEEGPWADLPRFEEVAARSLEEIARENAVEGCVYETWSALLNFWQAENAQDRVLRRALASIAEDELRHASLAWSAHEWLLTKLDSSARARVEEARREAASSLRVPPNELAPELLRDTGLPDCASSTRLVAGLDAVLWKSAA